MTINQLSIFIENKEGKLADLTSTLAQEGVDIRAMSVADTQDFGILRLIVSDPDRAITILKEAGFVVSVTQVIAVALPDSPGSLAKVSRLLADHHISIEYMYAFITRRQEGAYVVFRVANNQAAAELLTANGVKLATTTDIDAL